MPCAPSFRRTARCPCTSQDPDALDTYLGDIAEIDGNGWTTELIIDCLQASVPFAGIGMKRYHDPS